MHSMRDIKRDELVDDAIENSACWKGGHCHLAIDARAQIIAVEAPRAANLVPGELTRPH